MGHESDRMPDEDDGIFKLVPEEPSPAPAKIPRMIPRPVSQASFSDDDVGARKSPGAEDTPAASSPSHSILERDFPVSPSPAIPVEPIPSPASNTIAYHQPHIRTPEEDNPFPDKVIDFQMPVVLIVASVVIDTIAALIAGRGPAGLRPALIGLGIQVVVVSGLMLIGLLIAARFRGIDLGRLPVAILKLAAISIAPGAAVTLVSPFLNLIPFAGLVFGLGIRFVLYFALLGAMFKLDESDTWYCICVIFLVNLALYFTLLGFHLL